jgi:hypothetical protein
MTLSTKDKEKPFILMGAAVAGLVIQHLIGKAVPTLLYVTEIGRVSGYPRRDATD